MKSSGRMGRFGGDCGGLLAVGARKVAEVDVNANRVLGGVRVYFGVDDGDSAKKEIGDVSEAAARRAEMRSAARSL